MGSEIKIGSRYRQNLNHLMELVSGGQIKPEVLDDPTKKYGCYFCLRRIEDSALSLSEPIKVQGVDAISTYFLHPFCYNLVKEGYERLN